MLKNINNALFEHLSQLFFVYLISLRNGCEPANGTSVHSFDAFQRDFLRIV
jgi:hypothetical protein